MINQQPRIRPGLVEQMVQEELLIYNPCTCRATCLNRSMVEVWRACNGVRNITEISLALGIPEDLVRAAVEELHEEGLLLAGDSTSVETSSDGPLPSSQPKLSRRQALASAASLVVVPALLSVVVPTAAGAASCVVPGGAAPGTNLGGAGGVGACATPGAADAVCRNIRGNLCCSGNARATACFDSGPGPNFGTFSVACQCV